MKGILIALHTELIKTIKSKVFWITLIFFTFIAIMMGFLIFVSIHPEIAENSKVLSTKASLIAAPDWSSYMDLQIQLVLILGIIGPGFVTTWVFGREYSDRVLKDIIVLPVSRFSIVTAKFIIIFIWSVLLVIILFIVGFFAGLIVKLEGWTKDVFLNSAAVYAVTSLLTILLFTPVAFITCASRGYLLPFATLILILIITQFSFIGFEGITPYFPWSVPALCSGIAGPGAPEENFISYFILVSTSLAGYFGTSAWWRYADHH